MESISRDFVVRGFKKCDLSTSVDEHKVRDCQMLIDESGDDDFESNADNGYDLIGNEHDTEENVVSELSVDEYSDDCRYSFYPFHACGLFLHSLKTLEKQRQWKIGFE